MKKTKHSDYKSILKSLGMAFLMMLFVLIAVFASQIVIARIMVLLLGEKVNQPVPLTIVSALSYALAIIIIIWLPSVIKAKLQKKPFPKKMIDKTELGLRGFLSWTDIGLALVGFIAYFILASILTSLFTQLLPWFDAEETQEIGYSVYAGGIDKLVAFFSLVIVAPIAEEIIFRGWLYGKMRAKLSKTMSNIWSVIISVFLVSLTFGFMHLQWNVGVNVFAMSVILCLMREVTGTIYVDILMHMIKNGLAFYLLFVLGVG
ncbi:CPBP family intramembrane metalloprotease [Candidatus Saccharibacteria bacterium]|nr:CPBP family intramembrane metalloprotease [Candidatus Saccharibacteria bacterium]